MISSQLNKLTPSSYKILRHIISLSETSGMNPVAVERKKLCYDTGIKRGCVMYSLKALVDKGAIKIVSEVRESKSANIVFIEISPSYKQFIHNLDAQTLPICQDSVNIQSRFGQEKSSFLPHAYYAYNIRFIKTSSKSFKYIVKNKQKEIQHCYKSQSRRDWSVFLFFNKFLALGFTTQQIDEAYELGESKFSEINGKVDGYISLFRESADIFLHQVEKKIPRTPIPYFISTMANKGIFGKPKGFLSEGEKAVKKAERIEVKQEKKQEVSRIRLQEFSNEEYKLWKESISKEEETRILSTLIDIKFMDTLPKSFAKTAIRTYYLENILDTCKTDKKPQNQKNKASWYNDIP